jgi:hypothetical protein
MYISPKMLMKNSAYLDISQKPRFTLINRKFDRFVIGKDVYALMSWNGLKDHVFLGQLIDINKEGCGICYIADRSMAGTAFLQKSCKLKFISVSKTFELKENKVLYDNEIIQYSTERISVRRCGIKFDEFVRVENLC